MSRYVESSKGSIGDIEAVGYGTVRSRVLQCYHMSVNVAALIKKIAYPLAISMDFGNSLRALMKTPSKRTKMSNVGAFRTDLDYSTHLDQP